MTRHIDRYADGVHISPRRLQKAVILADVLRAHARTPLEVVDFGCADGAVPVAMLRALGGCPECRVAGITLLDYNDLPDKPAHVHPGFRRLVANLEEPLDHLDLPWGACDVVTATAFLHYCRRPDIPLGHAARLLRPGGLLVAAIPAPWVLRLRYRGVPILLARNTRIRRPDILHAIADLADDAGFDMETRHAIQWLGLAHSDGLERLLRRLHAPLGSNYLVIFRRRDASR
jgi:SAM-dependent methyltransferase